VEGSLRFVVNPVTMKSTIDYKATIVTNAQLSLDLVKGKSYSVTKYLTQTPKQIFRKIIVVKALIIILELEVQPYFYFEANLDVESKSTLKISSRAEVQMNLEINADDKFFSPTFNTRIIEDDVELESAASVSFRSIARIGPQFVFKVNKVPVKVDVMLALHLNAEAAVFASGVLSNVCASGSVGGSFGIDIRARVDFSSLMDPKAAAYEVCLEAMALALAFTGPYVDTANCFLEAFGEDPITPPDVCGKLRPEAETFLPKNSQCDRRAGEPFDVPLKGDWKHFPFYQLATKLNHCFGMEDDGIENPSDLSVSACRDDPKHFKPGPSGGPDVCRPTTPALCTQLALKHGLTYIAAGSWNYIDGCYSHKAGTHKNNVYFGTGGGDPDKLAKLDFNRPSFEYRIEQYDRDCPAVCK